MIIKNLEYYKKALHEISEQIKQLRNDSGLPKRSGKQLENLQQHYPGAIKCKSSAADFGVCNDVFVDLDSHTIYNSKAIFKAVDIRYSIFNLSKLSQYIGKISYHVSINSPFSTFEVFK